jgi:hypothetical protein
MLMEAVVYGQLIWYLPPSFLPHCHSQNLHSQDNPFHFRMASNIWTFEFHCQTGNTSFQNNTNTYWRWRCACRKHIMAIIEEQRREREVEDQRSDLLFFFSCFPYFFRVYINNGFVIRLQEQKCLFLLQDRRRDRHLLESVIWFLA